MFGTCVALAYQNVHFLHDSKVALYSFQLGIKLVTFLSRKYVNPFYHFTYLTIFLSRTDV
jgi:hypothetical protein